MTEIAQWSNLSPQSKAGDILVGSGSAAAIDAIDLRIDDFFSSDICIFATKFRQSLIADWKVFP